MIPIVLFFNFLLNLNLLPMNNGAFPMYRDGDLCSTGLLYSCNPHIYNSSYRSAPSYNNHNIFSSIKFFCIDNFYDFSSPLLRLFFFFLFSLFHCFHIQSTYNFMCIFYPQNNTRNGSLHIDFSYKYNWKV